MRLRSKPQTAFKAKSVVATEPRRFIVAQSADPLRPPKKQRKESASRRKSGAKSVEDMTDDERREYSLAIATRQAKANRTAAYSQAQDASDAQWDKLAKSLPYCSRSELIDFVCWANGIPACLGTLKKWEHGKRGRVWLSRIYWIRAIDMALNGYNALFRAEELVAIAHGYEDEFEMMRDQMGSVAETKIPNYLEVGLKSGELFD